MSYFAIIIKKRVKDLESKLVPDSDFFSENWFDFHVWIHWRSPENSSESQKNKSYFHYFDKYLQPWFELWYIKHLTSYNATI